MTATNTLTIVDLAARCAELRAAFLDLFEQLGAWVTDAAPGTEQRKWAAACHQHALHADWCLDRSPTIPLTDVEAATAGARGQLPAVGDDRAVWYGEVITGLLDRVAELSELSSADLDPATAILCRRLISDLTALLR